MRPTIRAIPCAAKTVSPCERIALALGGLLCAAPVAAVLFVGDRSSESRPSPSAIVSNGDSHALRLAPEPPTTEYRIEVKVDPVAHTLVGRETIRFRNDSDRALSSLFFHLYWNAFRDERSRFGRVNGAGFRGTGAPLNGAIELTSLRWVEEDAELSDAGPPLDPDDLTDIERPLPRPIAPAERMTLEARFSAQIPELVLRAGHTGSFHMIGQFFPKLAKLEQDGHFAHFPYDRFGEFYSDFGNFDLLVEHPCSFTVAAGGRLTRVETSEPGAEEDCSTRVELGGVHDVAFALWDEFDTATITSDGVELRAFFPREERDAAHKELETARVGLGFYGQAFGAYPYESLTIIRPPKGAHEAGGMEYPTLITTGDVATWTGPRFGLEIRDREALVLHELAHQWFYGLIATNEHDLPFLDEGLTTYATGLALDEAFSPPGVLPRGPLRLELATLERGAQLGLGDERPVASAASDFTSGRSYGALVYQRTATILRTADRVWPGASRLALARYARTYRFGHPTLDDWIGAYKEFPEAGAWVRWALTSGETFDVAITGLEVSREGSRWKTKVTVSHQGAALPVDIVLYQGDRVVDSAILEGTGDVRTEIFETAVPITHVVIDPEGKLLLDESKANDARTTLEPALEGGSFFTAQALGQAIAELAF